MSCAIQVMKAQSRFHDIFPRLIINTIIIEYYNIAVNCNYISRINCLLFNMS
jgi:hypothetical protein